MSGGGLSPPSQAYGLPIGILTLIIVAVIGLIVGIALGAYRSWKLAVRSSRRQPSVE